VRDGKAASVGGLAGVCGRSAFPHRAGWGLCRGVGLTLIKVAIATTAQIDPLPVCRALSGGDKLALALAPDPTVLGVGAFARLTYVEKSPSS
jgi:hypothetical protein